MQFINDKLLRLYCWITEEKAQTMAEYGLILALVSVVAVGIIFTVGGNIKDVFTKVSGCLTGGTCA
ncbi:MAG: Flp family type IVb pilin [Dehalococcoidia bacterium]|jgi:pilus assembly protein Flp/PilA